MILKRALNEEGVGVLAELDRQREGKLVDSFHRDKLPSGFLLAERLGGSEEGHYQTDSKNQIVLTIVIIGIINHYSPQGKRTIGSWETEETLAIAAVTLETERTKRPNP
jgi:hypothetical protein